MTLLYECFYCVVFFVQFFKKIKQVHLKMIWSFTSRSWIIQHCAVMSAEDGCSCSEPLRLSHPIRLGEKADYQVCQFTATCADKLECTLCSGVESHRE